jgi:hypothetical protein
VENRTKGKILPVAMGKKKSDKALVIIAANQA